MEEGSRQGLADLGGGDGHVVPGAEQIHEAQVDHLHRAGEPGHVDGIANRKRLLDQEHYPRDEVLAYVLQGKANRETYDTHPGQKGGQVETHLLQGGDQADNDHRPITDLGE